MGYGIAQAIGQGQYGESWDKTDLVKAATADPWRTAFRSLASGLMAGAASSIVQGGRVNWNSVIQTAVGSTIGEAVQAEARSQAAQNAAAQEQAKADAVRANDVSKMVSEAWDVGIRQMNLSGGPGLKLKPSWGLNANDVQPQPEWTSGSDLPSKASGPVLRKQDFEKGYMTDSRAVRPQDYETYNTAEGTAAEKATQKAAAEAARQKLIASAYRDASRGRDIGAVVGVTNVVATPGSSTAPRYNDIPLPYGSSDNEGSYKRTFMDDVSAVASEAAYRLQGLPGAGVGFRASALAGKLGSALWSSARSFGIAAYEIGYDAIKYGPLAAYALHNQAVNNAGIAAVEVVAGAEAVAPGAGQMAARVKGASSGANRIQYEAYTDGLRATMEKPYVIDTRLGRIMDELYRPNATVGSGSTAAAVRAELASGEPVGGAFHSQKALDKIKELETWLSRNQTARSGDRAAAENVIKDMRNAHQGKR